MKMSNWIYETSILSFNFDLPNMVNYVVKLVLNLGVKLQASGAPFVIKWQICDFCEK